MVTSSQQVLELWVGMYCVDKYELGAKQEK
jgi:hypothetical protein